MEICFFDLDAEALKISEKVHNHWIVQGWPKLTFQQQDCNQLTPPSDPNLIIINTSCEHFDSLDWWLRIPNECLFAIQSTDLRHEQHIACVEDLRDWKFSLGKIENILYANQKYTVYLAESFNRHMIIGRKKNKERSISAGLSQLFLGKS